MKKTRYYDGFDKDFIESKEQSKKLPENYRWLRLGFFDRLWSNILYGTAVVFSEIYCRAWLHLRFKNKKVLKAARRSGGFIYANHTQPVGDVFIPALAALPRRVNVVVSTANLGIPIIGKLLPYLGALPLPDSLRGMRRMNEAIEYRLGQKRFVVIYPEAHVWEYCTFIRPFDERSFSYPLMYDKPVFSITSTYRKSKLWRRPIMEAYIDGPFYPSGQTRREKLSSLHRSVTDKMVERSKSSTFEYFEYKKGTV